MDRLSGLPEPPQGGVSSHPAGSAPLTGVSAAAPSVLSGHAAGSPSGSTVSLTPVINPNRVRILNVHNFGRGSSVSSEVKMTGDQVKQADTAAKAEALFDRVIRQAYQETYGREPTDDITANARVDFTNGRIDYKAADGSTQTIMINMRDTGADSVNALRKEALQLIRSNSNAEPTETDFIHGNYDSSSETPSFVRNHPNLARLPKSFDAVAKAHLMPFLAGRAAPEVKDALSRIAYAEHSKHKAMAGLKGLIEKTQAERAQLAENPAGDSPADTAKLNAYDKDLKNYQAMLQDLSNVDDFALMAALCRPQGTPFNTTGVGPSYSELLNPILEKDNSYAQAMRLRKTEKSTRARADNIEGTREYLADIAALGQVTSPDQKGMTELAANEFTLGRAKRPTAEGFLVEMAYLAHPGATPPPRVTGNEGMQYAMRFLNNKIKAQAFVKYAAIMPLTTPATAPAPATDTRTRIESGIGALGINSTPPLNTTSLAAFRKLCEARDGQSYGGLCLSLAAPAVVMERGAPGGAPAPILGGGLGAS